MQLIVKTLETIDLWKTAYLALCLQPGFSFMPDPMHFWGSLSFRWRIDHIVGAVVTKPGEISQVPLLFVTSQRDFYQHCVFLKHSS